MTITNTGEALPYEPLADVISRVRAAMEKGAGVGTKATAIWNADLLRLIAGYQRPDLAEITWGLKKAGVALACNGDDGEHWMECEKAIQALAALAKERDEALAYLMGGPVKAAEDKPGADLSAELVTMADQLARMAVAAGFGGDPLGVRVIDPAYLVNLLRRAAIARTPTTEPRHD